MPSTASNRAATVCVRRNKNGSPCGNTTKNPWGDCGHHSDDSPDHAAGVNRGAINKLGTVDLETGPTGNGSDAPTPTPFVPTRIERDLLGTRGRELLDIAISDESRSSHRVTEKYSKVAGFTRAGPWYETAYRTVDKVEDEKWGVPNDPDVTPQILTHLLNSPHEDVVRAVARGEHTDDASRDYLAQHGSDAVRWDVACHLKTTQGAMGILKGDPDPRVRRALARREPLPDDIAFDMKDDPDPDVGLALLARDHLPRGVPAWMAEYHPTRQVRKRAHKRWKREARS